MLKRVECFRYRNIEVFGYSFILFWFYGLTSEEDIPVSYLVNTSLLKKELAWMKVLKVTEAILKQLLQAILFNNMVFVV